MAQTQFAFDADCAAASLPAMSLLLLLLLPLPRAVVVWLRFVVHTWDDLEKFSNISHSIFSLPPPPPPAAYVAYCFVAFTVVVCFWHLIWCFCLSHCRGRRTCLQQRSWRKFIHTHTHIATIAESAPMSMCISRLWSRRLRRRFEGYTHSAIHMYIRTHTHSVET